MANDSIKIIFDIISKDKNLQKFLKGVQDDADKTNKKFFKLPKSLQKATRQARAFGKSLKKIGGFVFNMQTAFAGLAAGAFFIKAVAEAKELENSLIGLSSVARNTGNDVQGMRDAAIELASDGLIPLTDVSNSLKNLLATGLSGDEAVATFKRLRDAAAFNRQGQLSLGEAVRGASEGLKNDLSIKVDNAGITKNLSNINKEYAASIGKTLGQLTKSERIQAKVVGIQREAAVFQGDYNKLLNTFSGATSEASGRFKFLLAEIGNLVTSSPDAVESVKSIATGFRELTKVIKENGPQLSKLFGSIADVLVVTPSKFWLELLTEGANIGKNVGTLTAEIDKLDKEIDDLNVRMKKNKALNEAFGEFASEEETVKGLSKKIVKLAELREELALAQEAAKLKKEEKGVVGSPDDDPEVILARQVNERLLSLREEREAREKEVSTIKGEENTLAGEEKLANLENQLRKEQEIKEIVALEEKAAGAKRTKDLEKIDIENGNRRLKLRRTQIAAEVQVERFKQQGLVNIAGNTAELLRTISGKETRASFILSKAAALGQIAIARSIALGAVPAQTASIPYPANLAAAGSMVALINANTGIQAATVAAATIQGFQNGGIIPGTPSAVDNQTIGAASGEAVLTRSDQAQLLPLLRQQPREQERPDRPQGDIVIAIDGVEVARAVRNAKLDGFQL